MLKRLCLLYQTLMFRRADVGALERGSVLWWLMFLCVCFGLFRTALWCGSTPPAQTRPYSRNCSSSWPGSVFMPVASRSLTWRKTFISSVRPVLQCTHIYACSQCLGGSKCWNELTWCCLFCGVCVSVLRHRVWWGSSVDWSWQRVCFDENGIWEGRHTSLYSSVSLHSYLTESVLQKCLFLLHVVVKLFLSCIITALV